MNCIIGFPVTEVEGSTQVSGPMLIEEARFLQPNASD
jgi:hypothetical protein